jgi:hypothetical protein
MPNEEPKKDLPESENPHEIDETPPAATVETRPSHPGMTVEERPSHPPASGRHSIRPETLAKVIAATAIGTGMVLANVEERKSGPPTPRPQQVSVRPEKRRLGGPGETGGAGGAGGVGGGNNDSDPPDAGADAGPDATFQEDQCGPTTFALDAKSQDMAEPGATSPCEFITSEDGTTRVIGHTLIGPDGIPHDCFVTQPFAKDAATKIRGQYHGSLSTPGKIYLDSGKLCVTMLDEQTQGGVETVVAGEASLNILTTKRVMIKLLEPEIYPETGELMNYAAITAVEGEALVIQEGREGTIRVVPGKPAKIPLNRVSSPGEGCYIASARPSDVEGGKGGLYILGASAIFMVLRRRQKNETKPQKASRSR